MIPKVLEKLRQKTVKNFIDILILRNLKQNAMSGYDILTLIHKRFDVLISSGTVYSTLYSLERKGLIKGDFDDRKRCYSLTKDGKNILQRVERANGEIRNLVKNILPIHNS